MLRGYYSNIYTVPHAVRVSDTFFQPQFQMIMMDHPFCVATCITIASHAKMLTALKTMRDSIGNGKRNMMASQARHGFELFGGQYTQFLQGARPTKEDYLVGVQRAFWISHMSG